MFMATIAIASSAETSATPDVKHCIRLAFELEGMVALTFVGQSCTDQTLL